MFAVQQRPVTKALGLFLAVFPVLGSAGSNNTCNATAFGAKCVIHIGGMFAFPNSPLIGTQQEVAQTALDHINSLDGILDGYHLIMRWNWTGIGIPSNPALGDRSVYPYTVRAYPSDRDHFLGVVAFIKEMGWKRIACIFEDNSFYQARQDVRIIYTGFPNIAATLKLFCQAYIAGLTGAKYVWIPPLLANFVWWLNNSESDIQPCTAKQILAAADSAIHFDRGQRFVGLPGLDFNGVKPSQEHYDYYNNIYPFSSNVIPLTYDGIVSVALALNASIADLQRLQPPRRLEDFSFSDVDMARGRVRIEDGLRKVDTVYVDQAQGGHVPVDGITQRSKILEVSSTVRAILFSLTSIGAVLALGFLFINVKYKYRRAIKMSSPSLGNLTVVGCLLLYASVFATGWDKTNLSDTAIVVKCHLERILISLGLSFAFGSIFMKTYRIHAIFSRAVKKFKQIVSNVWEKAILI
ncbi:gamma-aminobutyric acid type B receptor subunit 2-like [Acanthaster planci]|uniref:Gamma-aminobutyric acid type B receptor subunit 2-like n=1 Tax=Acanthaster planci TaxID=133434 RepID=A0A8B7Y816_ACAPL|nr:gamma-aminobutyric acid type B receptor subunit 2-like [Acanthaster planci]